MIKIWKKTRGWKLPLVGFIALVFAFTTVFSRAQTPAKVPDITPPEKSFPLAVAGIGVIEPKSEMIAVGTEISGLVAAVYIKVGSKVKAGAPLFSLDMRDIDAQILRLEAALESSQIIAADAADKYQLIRDVRNPQSVSKDEHNRAKFAAELANARQKEASTFLEQAKTTKSRMTITAPIDGTILDINVRLGEYAAAGNLDPPIIRMGDLAVLHVRVEIDEENAGRIADKANAEGIVRGVTDKRLPLTFDHIEPFVEGKQNLAIAGQRVDTRVLQIIYALPASTENLYPGQQMDVFIEEKVTTQD